MNSLSFATTPVPPTYPPGGAYTNRPDGYSFDVSGNMLNDGANNLTYDAENCLISAGNTAYTCDSHGIRVQKALQGGPITVYIFSGGKDIVEYDYTSGSPSPGSPSREYLYLGGQLAATMQSTTVTYHHGDHLSVRLSTGGVQTAPNYGQTVGEQGSYPYGEQWYATNSTTKFFFTSYERDPETGNDYAMARFYINRFGRFSCVDPSMGSPSDPQSWNRYAYARNNPINITDPSGQFWLFKLLGFFLAFIGVLLEPVSAGASSALISLGMNLAGVGFATPSHFGSVPGTPPTFPDPLGNTQATLNSIYHPIDPSQFGINNFTLAQQNFVPPDPDTFIDLVYLNYGADIERCRKKVFGKDARKIAPQGPDNSPALDTSRTSSELQATFKTDIAPGGIPEPRRGPQGTIDISKENWTTARSDWMEVNSAAYVHELGNILGYKASRFLFFPGSYTKYGDPNGIYYPYSGYRDTDNGANFEWCVFGKTR